MIDSETRARVAKLPGWAQDLIHRLELLPDGLSREAADLRRKQAGLEEMVSRLQMRCEAMGELFARAAVGGSDYADAVVRVLEDYEIYQPMTVSSAQDEEG